MAGPPGFQGRTDDVLRGGGEMGALMRSIDWPRTAVGPVDAWPQSFAHVISTQVAAHRLTKKPVYLEEARRFARLAVEIFWQDNSLPRASKQTGHYEAITGGDSLALALLEVHAATHGLVNRIPSNTIDR